jgi:hypothetical protein
MYICHLVLSYLDKSEGTSVEEALPGGDHPDQALVPVGEQTVQVECRRQAEPGGDIETRGNVYKSVEGSETGVG